MSASTPSGWKDKFCRRCAELRNARGWTQEQMVVALGIPLERYKKYEQRSPIPHDLLARFALLVNVDLATLYAVDKPLPGRPPLPGRRTT
jgi:transcriptional regulator with XRE-family HTH domain